MSGKGQAGTDPSATQAADGNEEGGLARRVRVTQLVLTAFGPFHGVPVNPTMQLLHGLAEVAKAQGCEGLECEGGEAHEVLLHLPPTEDGCCGVQLVVLETSGEGSKAALAQLHKQHATHNTNSGGVLWLHLGVDSTSQAFKLEDRAVNEADFRCADMRGWTPLKQPISAAAQPCLVTPIDTHTLVEQLSGEGWPVSTSQDAGKYVCNWLYFHSLQHCQTSPDTPMCCLFVHVPPSSVVCLERQRAFLSSLLHKLVAPHPQPLPAFLSSPLPPSYTPLTPPPLMAPGANASASASGLVTALLELGFDRVVVEAAAAHYNHDMTRLEAAAMWILEQGEQGPTTHSHSQPATSSGGLSLQDHANAAMTAHTPCKMVLCVRGDLNMGVGKIAAQCCYAALGAYEHCKEGVYAACGGQALVATWQAQGEPTIALRATDLQAIEMLEQQALSLGLPTHTVRDAGRTQVAAGSVTVLAIGPAPSDVINSVTGHLKLL